MNFPLFPFSSLKLPEIIETLFGRTSNAFQVVIKEWKDRQKILQNEVNLFCWDQ